ncbi:glycosyltransferase family 4 protein [Actinomycetospora atypica]|uniref:glycosyltransferase family 4 protein n=1 Tax=Actinomycetospora atypica TaxID=1290095 RepID=UPI003672DEFC
MAFVGPLPPPVHGASLVTVRLLERVREHAGDVRVVDVGGSGTGVRFAASRVWAHLRALAVVVGLPAGAVVYLSLSGGLGLWYQVPLVVAARLRGLRVVVHHHSYAYLTARSVPMVLVTRLLGPGDRHLFLSAIMRTAFLRRYSSRADHQVVSNAHVVTPGPVGPPRPPTGKLVLTHVSNLGVSKGSVAAVGAAEVLRRRHPGASLTLVGPCGDEETAAAIAAAGDAVRWLGPLPTAGVNEVLDDADVFLFPSSYVNEAEPLVVLEALSRGVPVIATRRGALPDLLPPEWLVESPDPDEIAARVEALCTGPTWRADAAARARALFAARRADSDPVGLVLDAPEPDVPVPGPARTAVLQVLPTFDDAFGGPVSAALGVSESYAGVDGISLWTLGAGRPGEAWEPYRTVARRSWSSPVGPRHTLSVSLGMLRWLLRHLRGFDLVHVHFHRGLTMVWVPLLARLRGVPYVLQTHGTCAPWRGPLALVDRVFTRPAIRHARAVCVLNAAERDQLLDLVPEAAVVVVHNAVRTSGIAPGSRSRSDAPQLLFCARLHPRKGLGCFLDVVERLAAERPGLTAHVVGHDEGELAAARARVARTGLPVTFHGGLERHEVDGRMAECDVLLHPAAGEPFGMSMLEAFAAGLPVVASATSDLAGVFAAEGAALLPPDGDVDAWTEAARRVLDEPELRERLRAGGRAVLDRHFSRASLTRVLAGLVSR